MIDSNSPEFKAVLAEFVRTIKTMDIRVERPELVIRAVRRVYDSALHNSPVAQPAMGGQIQ